LRKKLPSGGEAVGALLAGAGADTVCRGAHCPNRAECHARGQAAFLLLGPRCTRRCAFCAMGRGAGGRPAAPDPAEPDRVAAAAAALGLGHVVVTSVTRDDLPDGGAAHFAATVAAIRRRAPEAAVELLVPDFAGDRGAWRTVLGAGADVLNHNIETVPRLYPQVRPGAGYARSLELLAFAGRHGSAAAVKSGLMVGLGETRGETLSAAADLRRAGVSMVTVGQYLCPSRGRLRPVSRFVPPEEFAWLEERLRGMGFAAVGCGPWVRSSYRAEEGFASLRAVLPAAGDERP